MEVNTSFHIAAYNIICLCPSSVDCWVYNCIWCCKSVNSDWAVQGNTTELDHYCTLLGIKCNSWIFLQFVMTGVAVLKVDDLGRRPLMIGGVSGIVSNFTLSYNLFKSYVCYRKCDPHSSPPIWIDSRTRQLGIYANYISDSIIKGNL